MPTKVDSKDSNKVVISILGLGGGLFSTPLGGGSGNTGLFNQQQQQQQQQGGLFSQQTGGGLFSGIKCSFSCIPHLLRVHLFYRAGIGSWQHDC